MVPFASGHSRVYRPGLAHLFGDGFTLHELKQVSADGKLVWWQMPADRRTTFYGGGRSGNVEATAMAALARTPRPAHSVLNSRVICATAPIAML